MKGVCCYSRWWLLLLAVSLWRPTIAIEAEANGATSRQFPAGHPAAAAMANRARRLQTTTEVPYNASITNGVTGLRAKLLENYDKYSYPIEHYWEGNGRKGLPVELTINFHRVFAVEVTKSTADLIVWVRQVWNDPRLVWDPNEYNNITTVQFWVENGIGMGETSEIWTPDLHLWNAAEPLASSLADAHALVSYDGTVFWARPGRLRPACKFEGLEKFPFDTLTCTIEIGSWGHSGLYLRPVKLGEGFSKGGSQTAGEAYAEFTLDSIACEEYVYPPFIEAPEEDWPVMLYNVRFTRAWQPYARGFLVLQILLNLIGFSTFWLPPQAGERMGLSITALLASVASELVVTEKLPAFGEISWVTQFTLTSLLFTAMALVENSVVIYLHYHTGGSLTPRYVQWCLRKARERREHRDKQTKAKSDDPTSGTTRNTEAVNCHSSREEAMDRLSQKEVNDLQIDDHDDDDSSSGNSSEIDDMQRPINPTSLRSSYRPSLRSHDHLKRASFRQGIKTILGRDADDFKNAKEMENNARWQQIAQMIDDIARILYPVGYCIFLATKFSQAKF